MAKFWAFILALALLFVPSLRVLPTSSVSAQTTPPVITVSPSVAKWGDIVTVQGVGFRGGAQIRGQMPWDPASFTNIFQTAIYTDSTGFFMGFFVMPSLKNGVYSIGSTDGMFSATATIEVRGQDSGVGGGPVATVVQLASIASQLVRVWAFDAGSQKWKLYDPSIPTGLNTLTHLETGGGYFILVRAPGTLVTGGITISLAQGWNLIGWLDSPQSQVAPAPSLPSTSISGKVYLGYLDGHWVKDKLDNGKYILLEDSSLWEISTFDRFNSRFWFKFEDILIVENSSPLFPYKLINLDQGEVLEAKYLGK